MRIWRNEPAKWASTSFFRWGFCSLPASSGEKKNSYSFIRPFNLDIPWEPETFIFRAITHILGVLNLHFSWFRGPRVGSITPITTLRGPSIKRSYTCALHVHPNPLLKILNYPYHAHILQVGWVWVGVTYTPKKLTCPLKIDGWFRCISY